MQRLFKIKTVLATVCLLTAGTLAVMPIAGCSSGRPHETTSEDTQDREITSRVHDAFANTDYKFSDVKVETFKGTVELRGSVDSESHRVEAGHLAEQAGGVTAVNNHIGVR